jgi:hypothetical protein
MIKLQIDDPVDAFSVHTVREGVWVVGGVGAEARICSETYGSVLSVVHIYATKKHLLIT